MTFGDKVLHVRQMVNYHLHGRCINTWYLVPNGDEDLVNTRVLSEWLPPFKQNGIIIFMLDQYWQSRAYNTPTTIFASNPNAPGVPDTGYGGSAYRTTKATPRQAGYKSFDNGQISEFGLLHPIDFYISKKRIKIVENGFTKVDYAVDLNFDKCTVMPSMGSYHMANKLTDLHNQETAGNGHETGYFDLGMQDRRTFGPLELEIVEAIP